ncbi:MAG: 30S ribosomal protein S19 [Candidatus Micrarchaeota archaeon]|nr:30S ribosomal protein S19 [Candidatus Micrarchaeota archaeon]MDE1804898.1 30S ribosomal protein S19 [Candidatus Micrarchaeota archaeon]MDE1846588.1 30S ribosomal protein S19 [Candidatus Micrarchaeota archaeon]
MARVYTYRGMTIEDLQKLSVEDFTKLLDSRQRRAINRMGVDYKKLLEKVERAKKSGKVVKTQVREAVILPSWIGMQFSVHNGKEFKQVELRPEMLGHRLGEFFFSTKRVLHSAPGIRATRGSKFLAVK